MELRVYYGKIHEVEAGIPDADAVVVSFETPDGGRAGVRTEAPKRLAAKLVVDGKARLASEKEASEYRDKIRAAHRRAQELAAASKVQVAIVSDASIRPQRTTSRPRK